MSKTINEILVRLRIEPIIRTFAVDRTDANEEKRTVNLAFASGDAIEHWFGMLELSMDPKHMRTERLTAGAPLLMGHQAYDWRSQVGVVDSYEIGKDKVARADVRFSRSPDGEQVFQDVIDGIRTQVSVGFMVHDMKLVKQSKDGPDVYRSEDWEPYEISIVPVAADYKKAGVGRSQENFQAQNRAISNTPELNTMSDKEKETPETPAAVVVTRAADLIIADEIREWGQQFKCDELATEYLRENAGGKLSKEVFFERVKAQRPATVIVPPQPAAAQAGNVQLARSVPRYGKLKSFRGEHAEEHAYRFGQFLMASLLGNAKAREFCSQNGIKLERAMGESVNETGGYLVPDEFGNDLIDLREQFGVFRRNAKIVPMASDTRSDPRRTGGLTAYFVAEAGAITASDMAWDQVSLVAKKLAVLARYSSEINEDSSIAFGDTLAGEIAYAFAEKEDRCGFLGDGTDTYGGIRGATNKLLNLSATRADIAGLVVGSGNLFSELVLTDFEAVVGKLPQYADTEAAAWYVHRTFYWNVMVKLMLASGGVTAAEIEDARKQRYMGYRVEFTQVMPATDANDQIVLLFGDLAKAASMGIRRNTEIALSEHSRFANDQIEIRGTERFDINVHDVGNSSATAASRVPGPVVGMVSAAS